MKIENVVPLPIGDSGLQNCIIRLNNCRIDSKRKDRSRFFRREPLVVINTEDGSKVLRYAMGSAGQSICKNEIGLDYDAINALSIRFQKPVTLEVRRAKRWEVWQWFWSHPDQSVQLSIKLGFIGTVLGAMGFMIGIVPLLVG